MDDSERGLAAQHRAESLLSDLLGPDWSIHRDASAGVDFTMQRGGRRIFVEVKAASGDRLGAAAKAILQVRRYAPSDSAGVIAVAVPAVTERVAASIEGYVQEFAPDVEWLVFDAAGSVRGVLDGEPIERTAEVSAPVRRPPTALFSDLNRWLLKVLLYRGCPSEWWGGPAGRAPNATALAPIASVSVPKAHQFVKRLEELGYLARNPVRLRQAERLLAAWLQAEANVQVGRVPVQLALGGGVDSFRGVAGLWAIGGLAACDLMKVRHVSDIVIPDVHVADVFETCQAVGAVVVDDARDAHLNLIPSRYPESVFRGRVHRDGLWHVDLWQAALDTVHLRAGEQSAYLMGRLLSARSDA